MEICRKGQLLQNKLLHVLCQNELPPVSVETKDSVCTIFGKLLNFFIYSVLQIAALQNLNTLILIFTQMCTIFGKLLSFFIYSVWQMAALKNLNEIILIFTQTVKCLLLYTWGSDGKNQGHLTLQTFKWSCISVHFSVCYFQ